jgi:uncharacterized protein with von Willebrand factor type A (vWA) domain
MEEMSDLASLAVLFADRLRQAGLPMSQEGAGRLVRGLRLVNPVRLDDLYWVGRITLVTRAEDLDTFDRVFNHVFRGITDIAETRGDPASPPPARTRPPTNGASKGPTTSHRIDAGQATPAGQQPTDPNPKEDRPDATIGIASSQERLASTDFASLDEQELLQLQQLMRQLRLAPPLRPGRRTRRHRRGDQLDLRATLRRSRHTGGDPVEHVYGRRRMRARRLVVLCDISGSMAPYARAYVQFLHATAGSSRAEVFTFATRLTRLTRALRVVDPGVALGRAAQAAPDWRGGTRIGESLKTFLDNYGRRGAARRAIVVIVSDGWERDDPTLLGEQMARLGRLAHRVVWVNPRTADPRYQPLAGGMAAALPHCDAVVSGHTLAALNDVIAAIAS